MRFNRGLKVDVRINVAFLLKDARRPNKIEATAYPVPAFI